MGKNRFDDRRQFLTIAVAAGGSLMLAGCSKDTRENVAKGEIARPSDAEEEQVTPGEDLMREHGVLKRVLLIYGEAIRRIDTRQDLPPAVIVDSANIIRRFIEDYHEKLEEEQLFPRFRKAGVLADLVDVLEEQHRRGRTLTETILRLSQAKPSPALPELRESLQLFVRMYGPHEAREDTVLFPALRKVIPPAEYRELGEQFEDKEHQLFGEDGFEKNVEEVARLEKILGIYDLSSFTPPK
jgi:hemerythrin-like domain-containing protein